MGRRDRAIYEADDLHDSEISQSTLSDLLKQRKQSSITASLPDLEDVRGKDYYK